MVKAKAPSKPSAKEFTQFASVDRENWYSNKLRLHMLRTQEEQEKEHKWNGNLRPSGFKFSDCMNTYFDNVPNFLRFYPDTLYKVRMGTALHKAFEEFDLSMPGILARPLISDKKLAELIEKIWPEVPVFWPVSSTSGRIDNIFVNKEDLEVADKKFSWRDLYNDKNFDIPKEEHQTQVNMYLWMVEQLGYFESPPQYGRLIYINMTKDPFSHGWSREFRWLFTDELREACAIFDDHHRRHRNARLEGRRLKCKYPFCHKHGDRSIKPLLVAKPKPTFRDRLRGEFHTRRREALEKKKEKLSKVKFSSPLTQRAKERSK